MAEMLRSALGLPTKFQGNIATRWGENHEDVAKFEWELQNDTIVTAHGFQVHAEHEWIGVSPDGVIDEQTLIEIKCPFSKKIPEHPPAHYLDQVQLQMEVMDKAITKFWYWTPDRTREFTIERDPIWWEMAFPELKQFHEDYLSALETPELYLDAWEMELCQNTQETV